MIKNTTIRRILDADDKYNFLDSEMVQELLKDY